ncbi:uncharacterized protein LOC120676638 isoform X3 [Panicum virgatum]|uniref:Uncharacterized protein n=1 Tax=Panicum virgatum TaxID=38727 RepID=A0A8T0RJG4_PANVG|nr:uncharacterized protein LOC120676638 isoform X3 [Panicum virgatum]KAG2586239.1 hypothetical protein PVAP13_5NG065072 [Panicum virgatum]KAG2586241.1 hypothetical protein PVAP13_5NG065072 [Panicum virgatum]
MEASLSTLHAAAATGASAAPLSLHRCRGGARTRAPAVRAQGAAREPDPRAVPVANGGGPPALPRAALRVGAGVALALALGGASWTARGGSAAGPGPALQPAMVCALNAVTDGASRAGAATMKTSVDALSDSLFRREDSPRDRATLMDLVFEQVTKEHITDRGKLTSLLQKEFSASRDSERKLDLGLLLTDVLINQAVINMMMAVEGMLSPDTATTDDIEKMTKNAMDAWKEFKNKSELAKGSADSA